MFIPITTWSQGSGLINFFGDRLIGDASSFLADRGITYKLIWNRLGVKTPPEGEGEFKDMWWEIEIDDDVAERHMNDLVLFRLKFTKG